MWLADPMSAMGGKQTLARRVLGAKPEIDLLIGLQLRRLPLRNRWFSHRLRNPRRENANDLRIELALGLLPGSAEAAHLFAAADERHRVVGPRHFQIFR